MGQDFGIVFYTGVRPMMGVAKKIIEAIGYPEKFCIFVNLELKRVAIARDYNSNAGVSCTETEETNDYYWVKGGAVMRIAEMLALPKSTEPFYIQGKLIEADQAVTCEGTKYWLADLPFGNIPNSIKELSYPKEMVSKMAEWESKNKSNSLSEDMEFAKQMSSYEAFVQDKDFGWMIGSALRYSLGRDGCSPERTADFIRRYIDQFDETTLFVMKRDIDTALQGGALPCDVIWRSVSDDLSVQLEVAKQARNGK